MMKKRIGALLLTVMIGLSASAYAAVLPSNEIFSPGLVRLSEKMAEDPAVRAKAQVTVDDAFYARDLSLLGSMLEGTDFCYEGNENGDRLTIVRADRILGDYALCGGQMMINAKTYALDHEENVLSWLTGTRIPGYDMAEQALSQLQDNAILERVPLASVADFLEGLKPGDSLPFGFVVAEPIVLARTMSDDGTRLTRVDFKSGKIARADEEPYVITGYMRQPAGRAPKDTFELTVRQDDRNFIGLSYSALRESVVKSKNKKGEANVRTQLKAAGKINGSSISSRLTVTMANAWDADADALSEKITVSATLNHQDNTPGRRMQRLNKANVKLKNVIRITTHETDNEVIALTDDITLEAVMDENTFLKAGADIQMEIGADDVQMPEMQLSGKASQEALTAEEAMAGAMRDLAAAVYGTLEDAAKEKAQKGL